MNNGSNNIAGVVLAGGQSRRMGQSKALLDYHGKPLIAHMMDILAQSGCDDILISGDVAGYDCIADDQPFLGPAEAIKVIVSRFSVYDGFLVVPVDMPLLQPAMLRFLLQQKDGGYFMNYPLPAYITPPFTENDQKSVQGLLGAYGIYPVDLPNQFVHLMKNVNTPQDWQEVIEQ